MDNKVKFGLKNAYYAIAHETGGVVTYDTPVRIPGAVNLAVSPVGDNASLVADDIEYFLSTGNNGYDGTIEFAIVPDEFKVAALGEVVSDENVQYEVATAEPVPFALLFEFSGDKSAERHVLYKCIATRPNIEGAATVNKELKTETLNLQARYFDGGKVRASTRDYTTESVYNTWFTSVHAFNPKLATPIATPAEGEVDSGTSIALACAHPLASIYYTEDESEPTNLSTLYSSAIPITVTTTIKAKAFFSGLTTSETLTAVYTV